MLAGWIENPIKSVVLTFPIDKIVFPAVTLCPRDSRPDRWGTAIKIFDQLNTDCESKRWDSMFDLKADVIILNSLQRSGREKKCTIKIVPSKLGSSFYLMIVNSRPASWPLFIFLSNTTEFDFTLIVSCREDLELTKKQIDKIHLWCTQSSPILWLTRIWFLQISLKTWLFEKLPFLNLSHTMKIALYEIMRLDYF